MLVGGEVSDVKLEIQTYPIIRYCKNTQKFFVSMADPSVAEPEPVGPEVLRLELEPI